jgi:hypothetical protein
VGVQQLLDRRRVRIVRRGPRVPIGVHAAVVRTVVAPRPIEDAGALTGLEAQEAAQALLGLHDPQPDRQHHEAGVAEVPRDRSCQVLVDPVGIHEELLGVRQAGPITLVEQCGLRPPPQLLGAFGVDGRPGTVRRRRPSQQLPDPDPAHQRNAAGQGRVRAQRGVVRPPRRTDRQALQVVEASETVEDQRVRHQSSTWWGRSR